MPLIAAAVMAWKMAAAMPAMPARGDPGLAVPGQLQAGQPPRAGPGRIGLVITQPGPGGGLMEDRRRLAAQAAREHPGPAGVDPAGGGARAKDHASRLQVGEAAVRWGATGHRACRRLARPPWDCPVSASVIEL